MNKYESVIIINPNTDEEGIENLIKKVTDLINKDGKVTSVENLGKKRLAYEISKCKEGYYVIFYYETESNIIVEIERNFRITEEIIKFITVRNND